MKPKTKQHSFPPIFGTASLAAETIDVEKRTVELQFYSGAPVMRFPYFDEPYELEFEVSRKAAQLGRLNGGAAVIDSHRTYGGVGAILGVVEKAWIESGTARARVRYSKRDDVEPVWQDILDGIVKSVSMGTYILEMEEVTPRGATMKRFRATKWEPYEISMVAVPADPGAKVLEAAADLGKRPCLVRFSASASAEAPNRADAPKETPMKIKVRLLADSESAKAGEIVEIEEKDFDEKFHAEHEDRATEELEAPTPRLTTVDRADPVAARKALDEALAKDKEHHLQIDKIAAHYGLDRVWAQRHKGLGTDLEQARSLAADERAKRVPHEPGATFLSDQESNVWRSGKMAEALTARATRKAVPDSARAFAHFSLVDCALEILARQGLGRGLHVRGDAPEIVSMALHSTSDFPLLLSNVLNKILLPAYQLADPTYRKIAAKKEFKDFRAHNFVRAGDFPDLLKRDETGEYKHGTIGESSETVTAASWGRIVGFDRQAIINDDLGALADLASLAGQRVAQFENALFYATCFTPNSGMGPALADTVTVFHSTHNNTVSNGALTTDKLGLARAALMKQTSIDGLKLNTPAKFLLTSADSLTLAETLVAPIVPAQAGNVNVFSGKLEPVGEANLTGTRYYVLASPEVLPNFVWGYVGGAGPRTAVKEGFEYDGVMFKISVDFGVGAIDHRGGATGNGA